VNSESHDKLTTGAESPVIDRLPGKVVKLYQQAAVKGFSEEELVVKYTPLVLKMVHRIAPISHAVVDFEDLKSVAYFALVQCARSFDPEIGVAFEVYCKPRIRGAILDELRRNSTVSRTAYGKWKKLERAVQEQEEKLGRAPTELEVATSLGISVNEYREQLDDLKLVAYVSLDEISAGDSDSDFIPFQLEDLHQSDPSDQVGVRDLQELIRSRLMQMSPQQRQVLTFYYYEGLRFKDIALLLKVSESRICQIHTEAILALRAFLDRKETLIPN
jgi:RNA polymerase sigma factor for flagellar operon FliA